MHKVKNEDFSETESENEFRPLDERIDEFHPKATRTLFIGNLEKTTTYHDLLNIFQRFGEIVVSSSCEVVENQEICTLQFEIAILIDRIFGIHYLKRILTLRR